MVFLDHVQNLHIHAEKTHKDFGAHCMNTRTCVALQTGPCSKPVPFSKTANDSSRSH